MLEEKEAKLFRLAFDAAAQDGEAENAFRHLRKSLLGRNITAHEMEARLNGFANATAPIEAANLVRQNNRYRSMARTRMPFGVHEGKSFDEIPIGYFKWLFMNKRMGRVEPEILWWLHYHKM